MNRAYTSKNLYDKNFTMFEFTGIYKKVFGTISKGGIWLIYGKDKNGKSWASLILANLFRMFGRTLYISAEEGTDMEFIKAMKRAKIPAKASNLTFIEFEPLQELYVRFKKRNAPSIVFIDNLTAYKGDLKAADITKLKRDFPNITFIMVAHEERNLPYTAAAQMAHKWAKVIIRVQGLTMQVGGRCPGGNLIIDEEKALLYHGVEIKN